VNVTPPAIRLCIESTEAEFAGRIMDARLLSLQAWREARDDFEACVAAHYVARYQNGPHERLRWNEEALSRADAVGDDRVRDFYPSLYINMGHSLELLGERAQADHFYTLASSLGLAHTEGFPPTREPDQKAWGLE
jgi:hypothetical protein